MEYWKITSCKLLQCNCKHNQMQKIVEKIINDNKKWQIVAINYKSNSLTQLVANGVLGIIDLNVQFEALFVSLLVWGFALMKNLGKIWSWIE